MAYIESILQFTLWFIRAPKLCEHDKLEENTHFHLNIHEIYQPETAGKCMKILTSLAHQKHLCFLTKNMWNQKLGGGGGLRNMEGVNGVNFLLLMPAHS